MLDEPRRGWRQGSRRVAVRPRAASTTNPSYCWTTRQPEMTFFASITPGWARIIEAGWESVADKLERRQTEADHALLNKLAREMPRSTG